MRACVIDMMRLVTGLHGGAVCVCDCVPLVVCRCAGRRCDRIHHDMVADARPAAELLFLIELKETSSSDRLPSRASVCRHRESLCAADSRQLDGRQLAGTGMPSNSFADLIISR